MRSTIGETHSGGLPDPVESITTNFFEEINRALPGYMEGMYLTGSASLGDFYPGKSDIDFIVICKTQPDQKTASILKKIHGNIRKQFPRPGLNGSYITPAHFQPDHRKECPVLSYHEASLFYEEFGMAPVSLSELKNNAHTVFGVPGSQLPFEIGVDEISDFLHTNINSYWKKWMEEHSSWTGKRSLLYLFPRLTEWSVLGVGRQLFTLDKKKIVSKLTAGYYCLQTFPEEYHPIIGEAIAIRQDNRRYPFVGSYAISPSARRMDQTLECMHYTISRFNELWEKGQKTKRIISDVRKR